MFLLDFISCYSEGISTAAEPSARFTVNGEGLDRRVVCLSAGTAAVHLALIACGVSPGDEVLVQSYTFCVSVHVLLNVDFKDIIGIEKYSSVTSRTYTKGSNAGGDDEPGGDDH